MASCLRRGAPFTCHVDKASGRDRSTNRVLVSWETQRLEERGDIIQQAHIPGILLVLAVCGAGENGTRRSRFTSAQKFLPVDWKNNFRETENKLQEALLVCAGVAAH